MPAKLTVNRIKLAYLSSSNKNDPGNLQQLCSEKELTQLKKIRNWWRGSWQQVKKQYLSPRSTWHWKTVVSNFSLSLDAGETICLVGPSGRGKTTILRAIAGFQPVQAGEIILDGQVISSALQMMLPEKRCIGMMFQDYALFPHLTVEKNISFGLNQLAKTVKQARVQEMLELVKLPLIGNSYPHELSGGQQQRVALARALAPKPKVLLLDEPFSNLDIYIRKTLIEEISAIIRSTGTSSIIVTHNQTEASILGDQIVNIENHPF